MSCIRAEDVTPADWTPTVVVRNFSFNTTTVAAKICLKSVDPARSISRYDLDFGRGVIFGASFRSGSESLARVTPMFLCGFELACYPIFFDINAEWNGELSCG